MARRPDLKDQISPALERVVESRYAGAQEQVRRVRAAHPGRPVDELADVLVRQYAKDMALSGAVTGGAAASPVAGLAVAAAAVGADAAFNANRLGEMVMALGILYGHDSAGVEERTAWMWAVMGMVDSAAVGLTGVAARFGTRGGARLLARLPGPAVAAANRRTARSTVARLATSRGPWGLAAVLPYGIGAGVGAVGNLALVLGVGRAAKEFFGRSPAADGRTVAATYEDGTELLDDLDGPSGPPHRHPGAARRPLLDDVVDAEVVEGPATGPDGRPAG